MRVVGWMIAMSLVFAGLGTGAAAQSVGASARLPAQGIGYSVVQSARGTPARPYRIRLACTTGYRNATALCPTPAHLAYCPQARIVCR